GRTDRIGPGDGRVGWAGIGDVGVCAHLRVVVCAVISAFDAGDLGAPGKTSGEPHGEHSRLGSGVAEPDHVEARYTLAKKLGELDLERVGGREPRSSCYLL